MGLRVPATQETIKWRGNAAEVAVRSAQGPKVTLPGPPVGILTGATAAFLPPVGSELSSGPGQNAPQRTFSWGSCNTPSFSGESKHNGTPSASIRETSRRSQMWWKSSTSFVSPTGGLLKYTYKTHWLALEKQALNGEEAGSQVLYTRRLPWCVVRVAPQL